MRQLLLTGQIWTKFLFYFFLVFRLRKYVTPNIPNQPSEAHAHFMNELAKRLLTEAGGNHSTAIFTTPQGGAHSNPSSAGGS